MKSKRLMCILINIFLIVLSGCSSLKVEKEIEVKEIDKTDCTVLIKNINDDYSFQIHTVNNDYDIYDINNHKVNVVKEYNDSILSLKFKDTLDKNKMYFIKLKQEDSFVDEKLKNAKIIYFGSDELFDKNTCDYKVKNINIKDNYTLTNKKLNLGDLTAKLTIENLNKNVDVPLKNYLVFMDNKEVKLSTDNVIKGKHKIKVQFDYNDKKYEYEKEVNIKELYGGLSDKELISLAKKYYRRAYYLNDYGVAITTDMNDTQYYGLCLRMLTYDGHKVSSKDDLEKIYYQFFEKSVPFKQAYVYTYVQYFNGKPYHMLAEGSLEGIGDLTYYKVNKIKRKTEDTVTFDVSLRFDDIVSNSSYYSQTYNDEFTMKYTDGKWKVSQFKMRGISDFNFYEKYK